jgi:hypothetical protein
LGSFREKSELDRSKVRAGLSFALQLSCGWIGRDVASSNNADGHGKFYLPAL